MGQQQNDNLEKYLRIKRTKETYEKDLSRLEGERNGLLKQLCNDYKCKNKEEVEKLLKEKKKEKERADIELEKKMNEWSEKWEGKL